MTRTRQLIGQIVRLQVQTDHLKCGEEPHRWYDPAPITEVARLELDANGVRGVCDDGNVREDVHNATHAISRFRGDNGVSIGFTGHYQVMRERFGAHLADGIAGENILIASDGVYDADTLSPGLVIETRHGPVRIEAITIAAPCVEFSRFSLGYVRERKSDRTVTEALQFLHQGVRGFYATAPQGGLIRTGDAVYLLADAQH